MTVKRRVQRLEAKTQSAGPAIAVIIRSMVSPNPDGPEDFASIFATIVAGPNKGLRLTRGEDESEGEFAERVETAKRGA